MNKEKLICDGQELTEISELPELYERYEVWKEEILQYVMDSNLSAEQYRMSLHVMSIPFESKEVSIQKYHACINKTIRLLEAQANNSHMKIGALETIIENFGLYLQNMFMTIPENKATLKKEVLEQVVINNEYDVQHIMYAVIKALYPSARREVNQDIGYGTDRYDIFIEDEDTVIEIKCTRKDHSENKLFRELGEDSFFYKCSRLIIYVYDKQHVIHDIVNFVKTLERKKQGEGKEVKVYVEQVKDLI